ncbi:hypothetical protein [Candidatus Protochlamydia sp. W-9]|uniref:hypothetical protein n=1 Tax=Candidatus Protochlamydia sp. W-9 TaxID=1785087 RepID=UPI00096A3723|nr:hypothetical protein [Candidatus Protochlamydia sp. W-9]
MSLNMGQWIGVLLGLIVIALMSYTSMRYLVFLIKGKRYRLSHLLRGFREKIWMTFGLGFLFFGLYLGIVLLGSFLIDQENGQILFHLSYQHPIEFIYLGLFIFATISLLIYLVRMFIKYLYLTRSKGS